MLKNIKGKFPIRIRIITSLFIQKDNYLLVGLVIFQFHLSWIVNAEIFSKFFLFFLVLRLSLKLYIRAFDVSFNHNLNEFNTFCEAFLLFRFL